MSCDISNNQSGRVSASKAIFMCTVRKDKYKELLLSSIFKLFQVVQLVLEECFFVALVDCKANKFTRKGFVFRHLNVLL